MLATLALAFTLHGVEAEEMDLPSCGASERLLKETFHINNSKINFTNWQVAVDSPGVLGLFFQTDSKAYTRISLLIEYDQNQVSGVLTLSSLTWDRRPCADRIILRG